VTTAVAPSFVQTAEEYEENRAQNDEVWIKGFRDGETKIRPLIEPNAMPTYLEHYAEGFGYFPCSKLKDCVGCTDESAKVRQRSRRFAFNALNDRGHQQVYKMGSRLHEIFKSRQKRIGTICDRDYTIVRSGKNFNEISYIPEPGDKYEVEFSDALYDIPSLLAAKYAQAVAAYGGTPVVAQPTPAPAQEASSPGLGAPEVNVTKGPDEAQAEASDVQFAPPAEEQAPSAPAPAPENSSGYPVVDKMSAAELRDFLTAKSVDFPERAPRSRLAKLADEWIAANPPF
jgi:hypothetical protein